jgi:ribosomal protein L37AE/L43A
MIYGDEYGMEEEKRLAKGDIPAHTVWNCRPCDSAVVAGLI